MMELTVFLTSFLFGTNFFMLVVVETFTMSQILWTFFLYIHESFYPRLFVPNKVYYIFLRCQCDHLTFQSPANQIIPKLDQDNDRIE